MNDLHGKFVWHELMTTDTEAAGKFYGSVVGWTSETMQTDGGMTYTLFGIPGTQRRVAGLMTIPDELRSMGVPPNWTGYVYVDDVDAAARKVTELGGSIRRAPDDIPAVGRFAVIADPQGATIILFKPIPPDTMPPELDPFTPGLAGWAELYAGEWKSAFDFYSKLFGWTRNQEMDMGEMGTYLVFDHDGHMAGGMMTKTPNVPVPCWGYYFNVAGIDAAADKVKTGGGMVLNGPMEVPGGGFIVNCTDPQGAFFSLTGPRG